MLLGVFAFLAVACGCVLPASGIDPGPTYGQDFAGGDYNVRGGRTRGVFKVCVDRKGSRG